MTIENMIKCYSNLTPTENQLAQYILQIKNKFKNYLFKSFLKKLLHQNLQFIDFAKKLKLKDLMNLK